MERYGPSSVSQNAPSSPQLSAVLSSSPANPYMSPTRASRRKEKRNPSVTPRRFGRFFTPRSSLPITGRSILGNLNAVDVNHRQPLSPQSLLDNPLSSDPICPSPSSERVARGGAHEMRKRGQTQSETVMKRRRVLPDDMPPPRLDLPQSLFAAAQSVILPADAELVFEQGVHDGLQQRRRDTLKHFFRASRGGPRQLWDKTLNAGPDAFSLDINASVNLEGYKPSPIRKFGNRGFEAQLLDREQGFSANTGRRTLAFPACDARQETARFYSHGCDSYQCTPLVPHNSTIPFSLASSHREPITAIGDEAGFVRFFNTTESDPHGESKVDNSVRVHDNAIMGLDFSSDDRLLATACGDRSGRVLDVASQSITAVLGGGHWDSLRQVSFQPGRAQGSVIATSDRIGRLQIWDLRCQGAPINSWSNGPGATQRNNRTGPIEGTTVNTIDVAHSRTVEGITSPSSVTAIQWMPEGREHLLLTASEANASIKLWDTRYIKRRRQAEEVPLAATPEPATHAWRSYGITSLALSSDAARLYAVCKDSTVYAYSTAHLILGHAPELVDGAIKRRPTGVEGLGPLYGLKHDMFRAHSFYVKCAIRQTPGLPELLAVGSSNHCAVLFPTDDRYMRTLWAQRAHLPSEGPSVAPTPSQSFSTPSSLLPNSSPIPIFRSGGTPLIRGHAREVTVLSWSCHGRLVTASDDCSVRQWQEGYSGQARHLRTVGEFGGERHMAGWADVGDDWDKEDDEEG